MVTYQVCRHLHDTWVLYSMKSDSTGRVHSLWSTTHLPHQHFLIQLGIILQLHSGMQWAYGDSLWHSQTQPSVPSASWLSVPSAVPWHLFFRAMRSGSGPQMKVHFWSPPQKEVHWCQRVGWAPVLDFSKHCAFVQIWTHRDSDFIRRRVVRERSSRGLGGKTSRPLPLQK